MYRLLFTNWKIAALWALGTLASLGAVFAGGEDSKMNRMLNEVANTAPPPAILPSDEPVMAEDEAEEPAFVPNEPATATVEEQDGVTVVTLPDGRRAVLQDAAKAAPVEPGEDMISE